MIHDFSVHAIATRMSIVSCVVICLLQRESTFDVLLSSCSVGDKVHEIATAKWIEALVLRQVL